MKYIIKHTPSLNQGGALHRSAVRRDRCLLPVPTGSYCPVPTGPYCPAPAAEAVAKKKSSRTANAIMSASSSRFASTATTTGSVHDFEAAADATLVPSHLDSVDLPVPVVWRSAMSVASTAR